VRIEARDECIQREKATTKAKQNTTKKKTNTNAKDKTLTTPAVS
jgi:hypothetical protein